MTDFYFQRIRHEPIAPVSQRQASSPFIIPGIPTVRSTAPGDDVRDYAKLKATLKAKYETDSTDKDKATVKSKKEKESNLEDTRLFQKPNVIEEKLRQARRFHLAKHLSSVLNANPSGGIRKKKPYIRPPIATFVERQQAKFNHERKYLAEPVDKVVEVQGPQAADPDHKPDLVTLESSKRAATNTFLMSDHRVPRTGNSITDHPSTWDHDSDQLADQLAALAMEMDPDVKEIEVDMSADIQAKSNLSEPETTQPLPTPFYREDDFVYETYIKVNYDDEQNHVLMSDIPDTNIGVLVIDSEDEDLWNQYAVSDDDEDWDEEDSNAEDNPANDYPEDEVSSDDEFGSNAYKYRNRGSDQEEYDDEYDDQW